MGKRFGDSRNIRKCHNSRFSQFYIIILNLTTAATLLAVYVYVAHRKHNTDEATVKDVLKDLQDKKNRCQAFGEIPGTKLPRGRIVSRRRKFRIETVA